MYAGCCKALLFVPSQPLYMHCSMSTADSTATPTAKACTYDYAKKRYTPRGSSLLTILQGGQKPATSQFPLL